MRFALLFFCLIITFRVHAGDVLIVDLNNSDDEKNACARGMSRDQSSTAGNVLKVGGNIGGKKNRVTPEMVASTIRAYEDMGFRFDTILISGHDGTGEFFGDNGKILSSDFKAIVDNDPILKESVQSFGLNGCYTATVSACNNFWMRAISDRIKTVVGFPLQSPLASDPRNWKALEYFCQHRNDIAQAQNSKDLTGMMNGFPELKNLMGICTTGGVCAKDYGGTSDECFKTYDELQRACQTFDPSNLMEKWKKYMNAQEPGYENPPPDKDEYITTSEPAVSKPGSWLRQFYNDTNLWRHCENEVKARTGAKLPQPPSVIRMTRFETLKREFAKNNSQALRQYNCLLNQAGLGNMTIDPATMSRKTIVNNIRQALSTFNYWDRDYSEVNKINIQQLIRMADGMSRSLDQVDPNCTPFEYVEDNTTHARSSCVHFYSNRYWLPQACTQL